MPNVKKASSLAKKQVATLSLPIKEVIQRANERFKEAMSVLGGNLLTGPVDLPKAVAAHDALANYEEFCSDLNKQAKKWIEDFVITKKQGTYVEGTKGTYEAVVDGRIQRVESRYVGAHDDKKLTALLNAKALPLDVVMDKVYSYELNEQKLSVAVAEGKLTQAEVDACLKKVTYTVKRSTKVEE